MEKNSIGYIEKAKEHLLDTAACRALRVKYEVKRNRSV